GCGAWSPPIASRAMRRRLLFPFGLGGNVHHLLAVVPAALQADAVRCLGLAAVRAVPDGGGLHAGHPLGAARIPPGARLSTLLNRHLPVPFFLSSFTHFGGGAPARSAAAAPPECRYFSTGRRLRSFTGSELQVLERGEPLVGGVLVVVAIAGTVVQVLAAGRAQALAPLAAQRRVGQGEQELFAERLLEVDLLIVVGDD